MTGENKGGRSNYAITARTALHSVAYTPVHNWNEDVAKLKTIAREGLAQFDAQLAASEADSVSTTSPALDATGASSPNLSPVAAAARIAELEEALREVVATGCMSNAMAAWTKCIKIAEAVLKPSAVEERKT